MSARDELAYAALNELEVALFGDNLLRSRDELTERAEALVTVATAAREVERILRQSGVTDSRIADLRAALSPVSLIPEEGK